MKANKIYCFKFVECNIRREQNKKKFEKKKNAQNKLHEYFIQNKFEAIEFYVCVN